MRKIVNHKITKITYSVISIILMVCFVLAVDYRVIKKENLFIFLPGLLLSITLSIIVIAVLVFYKKVTLNNIIHFHKFKFIFYISSLTSIVLLIFGISKVYYILNNYSFLASVGMDQAAYWRSCAPLVYLSYLAMTLNILSCLILFFLPKSENNL